MSHRHNYRCSFRQIVSGQGRPTMTLVWPGISNLPTLFHPQIIFFFPFCCYSVNAYGMYSESKCTHHLLAVFSSINVNQTHNMYQTPQELGSRMNKIYSLFCPRQRRRDPVNTASFACVELRGHIED